jgi:glucuronate isomerase
MSIIAYPPVLNATRIVKAPKLHVPIVPPPKRKPRVVLDRVQRAQLAFDEFNRQGMKIFRQRGTPQHFREIIRKVAEEHNIPVTLIASKSRARKAVMARNAAMYAIKEKRPMLSSPQIARWFDRDHTSVLHGLASYASKAGLPNLVGYDIERVRRRNARIAAERRETR